MKMNKTKRVPTNYAVSRKQKRQVARNNMIKEGKKQFNKHSYHNIFFRDQIIGQVREPSFFANNWREYAVKEIG